MLTTPSPLLDETAAAEFLAVGVRFLQKARVSGRGPAFVKVGSRVRYRLDDLQEWIDSRRVMNTAQADALRKPAKQ